MVKKLEFEEKILQRAYAHNVHTHDDLVFPKGFLWGTATSAHQVEGNNEFNDWHWFEKQKDAIFKGQQSGMGPDHYRRYKEDFKIMKKTMHSNAHRLSIEWSRIEPYRDNYHTLHIQHYHHVFEELRKQRMKIVLTLNHFTLPYWFFERGGWLHKDAIKDWERFVSFVVKEYGKYIDAWVTLNEPMVYATQAYLNGEWPPARNSLLLTYRCMRRLVRAHSSAYTIIKAAYPKVEVGIAKSIIIAASHRRHSVCGQLQEFISDKVWNHWFFDKTRGQHDYIGINYYLYHRLAESAKKQHFVVQALDVNKGIDRSDLGWEIFPQGIYEAIIDMADYGLPIYIMENGIATRNDNIRVRYLIAYLQEVFKAIHAGVKVKGYFYWSFLDNFEWDKGYDPKFGMVRYNPKTLRRMVKKSAKIFGEIARTNRISHEMLRFVGHGVR